MILPNEKAQKALMERFANATEEVKISMLLEMKGKEGGFPPDPFIENYLKENSERVRGAMVEYLSRLPEASVVPVLVQYVEMNQSNPLVDGLLTACWQSSLDFSAHTKVFVGILVRANYQQAFEAFTVIENAIPDLTEEQRQAYAEIIKDVIEKVDPDKQNLLSHMLGLLNG